MSRKKLKEIFQSSVVQNLDEMDIVKYFGNKRTKSEQVFAFVKDLEEDTEFFPAAPLYEFGKTTLTFQQRKNIFERLPENIKQLFPEDFEPIVYHDKFGRVYKYEDRNDLHGQMIWSVAIPRSKFEKLDFPLVGDVLELFKKNSSDNKQKIMKYEVIDIQTKIFQIQLNTTVLILSLIKE